MAIIDPVLRFRAAAVGSGADPLAARQNPVVTQIITRPYTTITALVTLGPGGQSTTAPEDTGLQTTALQTTVPTSTTTSAPSSTSSTPSIIVPASPSSSSSLSQSQLGAIIGSVLGFALLLLLLWYCVLQRRRQDRSRALRYADSSESETSSDATSYVVMSERRTTTAAGGGTAWVRRDPGIGVVPPPPRFPPTPRYTPYRQTRAPQFRGVRRYP